MFDKDYLGLEFKRLNRSSYILSMLASMFLFIGIGLLLDFLLRAVLGTETKNGEPTLLLLPFVISWWIYAIYNFIRRLHDLDMSSWWLLALLVPFINAGLSLILLFAKGSKEPNRYGKPLERVCILGLML